MSRFTAARAALARFVRSARQGQLRSSAAVLRAQQEATVDGILVVDLEGRVVSYNRQFLDIWGIPDSVAAKCDDNELLGYAAESVADWEDFIELVHHLYSNPEESRTDDTVPLKDGRVLSRATVPVIHNGAIAGRAWYFRDITDKRRAEKLQSSLFRIAELSRESESLESFYASIHRIVGELMDATNFYIAEYDRKRDILTFPYFVDQCDPSPPVTGQSPGRGLTAYVLRTGEPLLAKPSNFEHLVAEGEVESVGAPSVDWLGVPLKTGDVTWGVLGVQSYDERNRYRPHDLDILVFVSRHVASAIEHKRKEEAIRASERRYRQMFENNRAVQLLIDPQNGRIIDANVAASEFYGYSLEQLRSMAIWEINTLGEEGTRREMIEAASQNRTYFRFRHRLASGEIRDVEVHSGPIDVDGRPTLYSIVHDVTERKRAEEALRVSEERYRNIFDYASIGIYQSTRDGRIVTANQTLATMLGYESVEELQQQNLARDIYFDPDEREQRIAQHAPLQHAANLQLRWKRHDGSPIWIQLSAHSMILPDGGPGFEGFVYDITEQKRAEESLASANAQRKAVLDAATRVSIIATDSAGMITVFNSGAERLLGYSAEEMIGHRTILYLHLVEELGQRSAHLSAQVNRGVNGFEILTLWPAMHGLEEREWTYVRKDGTRITVLLSVTALRSEAGAVIGFLHVGTDITERKLAEQMLRRQSAAMTASMDGIGILNERLEFTYVNDALAKLYAAPHRTILLGRSIMSVLDTSERERFTTHIVPAMMNRGSWRGEARGRRINGDAFPQEISLTSIEGGGIVCIVRDITERTYAEEQIKHLAYHDALTALPNRLLFKDRLSVALSHAQREKARLAVLFLDLDRFKVINDSLGHNVGDQLLQSVADRIAACIRDSDTLARLGGDEFTLLLSSLTRSDDAAHVAEKILAALRQPFTLEGREFFISTSIGISLYPEDGTDAETLIKNADTAMYQAKEQGRDNYQLFNAQINVRALERIALEHALRRALLNEELAMHYQPIFDLRTGRLSGAEALMRWRHPELGDIAPSLFIPTAESIGMMVSIGTWGLRTACAQGRAWHDAGFRNLGMAVNLSVTQLQQPDLIQRVQQILDETGFPARLLELEITESSAMLNPETSIRTLYDLKKLGVRISVDDFGTGHSSLSYLKRFPIDTLKIDKSFIRDITSDSDTAAIVKAIIAMAHSLRLKVVAEGVEFSEQAAFLREHSCDQMQGYLIRSPVPAAEFLTTVATHA